MVEGVATGARWRMFIRERFSLAAHAPMILVFALANGGVSLRLAGGAGRWESFAAAWLVAMMFFFRLRCFDEIKDHAVDCRLNPTRPLARGLLTPLQVKAMCVVLVACELAVAGACGRRALGTHAVAVLYSFLMYREFFIGRWLRPRLTTYAVTHTLVSMLMGWSVGAMVSGVALWRMPAALWAYGPVNWLLFNVFEFARKTFARDEETRGADSYSLRFGAHGAAWLCMSQVAAAVALLALLPEGALATRWESSGWLPHAGLALLPLAGAVRYAARPTVSRARVYRGVSLAYQWMFYAVISMQSLVGGG